MTEIYKTKNNHTLPIMHHIIHIIHVKHNKKTSNYRLETASLGHRFFGLNCHMDIKAQHL